MKFRLNLYVISLLAGALSLLTPPGLAQGQQWPPFTFRLTPTYANGQITYDVLFVKQFDGNLTDIDIKIPLPEGTRFVSSNTQVNTAASFDGREVTFFTAVLDRNAIRVASFTVEPTDSAQTVFTTQPWLSWKGDQPGDFLADEVALDISQTPLAWSRPPRSRVQLEATAVSAGGVLTYTLQPDNVAGRMWDVAVKLPLPAGSALLAAEPAHPFVVDFDGREVTFFAAELPAEAEVEPLQVIVSTGGITTPLAVSHGWATWKNVGRAVGNTIPLQEDTRTGDIVAQPGASQWLVADSIGDVPFPNYDVTSLAISHNPQTLEISYFVVGDVSDAPLVFVANFNTDCADRPEYQAIYNHTNGQAQFRAWNAAEEKWEPGQPITAANPGPHWVMLSLDKALFAEPQHSQDFCVQGVVQNQDASFSTRLPGEVIPNANEPRFSRFQAPPVGVTAETAAITPTQVITAPVSEPPAPAAAPSGLLAVPLDNGQMAYNVHLFSVPDGRETGQIANARQPHFRADVERLLVSRDGAGQYVFEVTPADGSEQQVSGLSRDLRPFYDPSGGRLVFDNALAAEGSRMFVQCGLLPPSRESDPRCKDIVGLGILVSAGPGDLQGSHPVWTAAEQIVYNGCNSWAGGRQCGLYSVPAGSTPGFSDGITPVPLSQEPSDLPSDTRGNLLAFSSQRDGNWEAYLMKLDGGEPVNLSSSPASDDGLPAISPDGQWVAFVSNRGGGWAVWVTPASGGEAAKLFDLPANPWGSGDRDWLTERISWGQPGSTPLQAQLPPAATNYAAPYPPAR